MATCHACRGLIEDLATKCIHCQEFAKAPLKARARALLTKTGAWAVALLIGGVLTSWLVPAVTARLDRQRLARENRFRVGQAAMQNGLLVEAQVNSLLTTFAVFYKDTKNVKREAFGNWQREMHHDILNRYLEFDSKAWWWYQQTLLDAEWPEPLSESDRKELQQLAGRYDSLLKDTSKSLEELWNSFVRVEAQTAPRYQAVLQKEGQKLTALGNDRREVIIKMAGLLEKRKGDDVLSRLLD